MSNADSHAISESHFIGELGLTHWVDREVSYGKADITAEILVPGTSLVRIGILAMFADLLAGQPPSGAMNPTTDLSVHIHCQPVEDDDTSAPPGGAAHAEFGAIGLKLPITSSYSV